MADPIKVPSADEPADELQELETEIRRIIDSNKKFLDRILEDDFDSEEEPDDDEPIVEEL